MQDIRLRTGTAVFLSLMAFMTIGGAFMALFWWLLFSHPLQVLKKMRIVFPAIIMILFFGFILEISGGGGISYCLRMSVIVLLGAWVYNEYRQGEFLRLWVWLLGKRTGFDLGLMAEMGMQSLDLMMADYSRIREAYKIKGERWEMRSLVPAGNVLINGALRHADDTTELMAIRGYVRGGTYCPEFETPVTDIIAALAVLCMGVIVFIPVSEFFILYH